MQLLLEKLYPGKGDELDQRIHLLLEKYKPQMTQSPAVNQSGALLIAYGDHLYQENRPKLEVMNDFLVNHSFSKLFTYLHLLPFYPYTSDDGFSVVDYRKVREDLGDWRDINRLSELCRLVFDFPLNHSSSECPWFKGFLNDDPQYADYYVTAERGSDVSQVVRPRAHPLLTEFGEKSVWTTFSADQVDLNFENPEVLCEVMDVFLFYIAQGARIIRLDAIAYLWKKLGTTCIHLEETHLVVKLFRQVVEKLPVEVLLLTETNVPHAENMSYFGEGDEAHLIYQFSLPPLLLYTLWRKNVSSLADWLVGIDEAPSECSFLNFTASHDGVGVRPLEDCLPKTEFSAFVSEVRENRIPVSEKKNADGSRSPYEINCTYRDLVRIYSNTDSLDPFYLTQAFAAALRGVPAYYLSSMFAEGNDWQGYRQSEIPRRLNRRKFDLSELENRLDLQDTEAGQCFNWFGHFLQSYSEMPALQAEATQKSAALSEQCLRVERTLGEHHFIGVFNFSATDSYRVSEDQVPLKFANCYQPNSRELGPYGFAMFSR